MAPRRTKLCCRPTNVREASWEIFLGLDIFPRLRLRLRRRRLRLCSLRLRDCGYDRSRRPLRDRMRTIGRLPRLPMRRRILSREGGDGDGGGFSINPSALSVRGISATASLSVAAFPRRLALLLLMPTSASSEDDVVSEESRSTRTRPGSATAVRTGALFFCRSL
jgi:hypothetical protein